MTAVGKIVKRSASQSPTVGATRSTRRRKKRVTPEALKSIWTVRTDRARPSCVRLGESAVWRRSARKDATVVVWNTAGVPVRLQWPGGRSTLTLPADALKSAERLSVLNNGRSTDIDVALLPEDFDLAQRGRLLQWFADKGCSDQARRFVKQLHAAGAK